MARRVPRREGRSSVSTAAKKREGGFAGGTSWTTCARDDQLCPVNSRKQHAQATYLHTTAYFTAFSELALAVREGMSNSALGRCKNVRRQPQR
jgi:hypothetical protein